MQSKLLKNFATMNASRLQKKYTMARITTPFGFRSTAAEVVEGINLSRKTGIDQQAVDRHVRRCLARAVASVGE